MSARSIVAVVCARLEPVLGVAFKRPGSAWAVLGLAVILMLSVVLVPAPAGAATMGDQVIRTSASLDYCDANGAKRPTVRSNTVLVVVSQPAAAPSVDVTPVAAVGSGFPGSVVYYAVSVRNQGREDDRFALRLSSVASWDAAVRADDGSGGGIAGDGVHQPSENSLAYSTGTLAAGEAFSGFVAVAIPIDAAQGAGDMTILKVASELMPDTQATASFTTTAEFPPLRGQVTDRAGSPLIAARVDVYADSGRWVDSTLTVPPLGTYEFGPELLPGTYGVVASCAGYTLQNKADVSISSGATARVDFSLDPVAP